ncbi:hypothetical protein ACEPAH_6294 [Sanghuangporus vaninii]
MSDLDADLYGDLYGDENDFSVPTEEAKDTKSEEQPPEKPAESSTPTATATPAANEQAKSSPPPQTTTDQKETSPIPTFTNGNAPQPIQSYQSSTPDYSSRINQGYQNQPQRDLNQQSIPSLPIVDRHIRPSEMKDEGKMFIGGLNWDTTDEGLKKYFEKFGKVEACTIMRDATGRSRCFAFLTFEDPASVNAVMVREHVLDGKIIDPKRAIPRSEHQKAQKLFIGGLAGTVTSESMREFFSQYGTVIDSTVMLDRETGRSKGFGFVSFENTNVEPLLGFGNLEIDGKMASGCDTFLRFELLSTFSSQIDVKLAQPRHQREGDGGGNFHPRGGGYNGGQHSDSYGAGGGASGGGFAAAAGAQTGQATGAAAGGTPFDPQALAQLYTRMFQQFGGAAGMGGMGNMGAMANMMGGMGGGMGAGMGGGMGMTPGMSGMGGGMGGGMGRMGSGGGMIGMGSPMGGRGGMSNAGMMGASGPMNAPRGPRGGSGGPQGIGPQRTQRGHNYHPYSR